MSSLIKGNTYYAQICASNSAGAGAYSTAAFKQAVTKPSAPTLLTVTPNAPLQIVVTWLAPTDTGLGVGVAPAFLLGDYRYVCMYVCACVLMQYMSV
jgi:hypothetical protein